MNTSAAQVPSSPSSSSIPRIGSFSSIGNGSDTSLTSYSSLNSHSSPIPHTLKSHQYGAYDHYPVSYDYTRTMNATQSYASHPHHGYMENHHAHMNSGAMPASMPPYSHYQGAPMQPPMASYSQPSAYHYPYPQVVSSQPHPTQHYAQHTLPAPPPTQQSSLPPHNRNIDQTGQVQPPNHKPKLTGTVWEDEGTICFQVEVNGICVARREDNHYINGTKLLNVANMTRGRRDGILKSEKLRSVIKIGPMHLKGVWIPFDRALEFANKEKITEQLYPLFVENISPLLTPHMQETLRGARLQNGQQQLLRNSSGPQSSQPTSSHQQPASTSAQPATPSSSLVTSGRTVERSSTFPTPPTSTSSIIGASQNSGYNDWSNMAPSTQAPLSVDTSAHGKSLPATPTTGPSEQSMQQQYPAHYDPSRSVYSAPPPQHYGSTSYAQMYPIKTEMAAPARPGDKEEDSNHYGHDQAYGYNSSDPISGETKSSPHTQGSGRATPRSITTPQQQWQGASYSTPQGRSHHTLPSSSLTFGSSVASNGYAAPTPPTSSYAYSNGTGGSLKRGRDDEDDDPYARPMSGSDSLKRRRTMPLPSEVSRSAIVQQHM